MRAIRNLATLCIGITMTLFLFSCGDGLSRGNAKDLIIKKMSNPLYETEELHNNYSSQLSGDAEMLPILQELQQKGVVVLSNAFLSKDVKLTDEGQKHLVKYSMGFYKVRLGELAFGEITGIQMQEESKEAEVNYTLIRVNPTPFSILNKQEIINKTAVFTLYDDGWRVTGGVK